MDSTERLPIQAGAAWRDITPDGPMQLYGYPNVKRVSTGVHDPLGATVLVLRNGETTLVLASLDLLMIAPPLAREFRTAVAAAVGCDETGVLIGCTHTHSGPVTCRSINRRDDALAVEPDEAYLAEVRDRLVDAAKAAATSVQPAELAWTHADATGVGGNRISDDGPTDPDCGVLLLRDADTQRPLAAALVYGVHPTVMHEDSTLISSDFPHYARRAICEHLDAEIPIAYHLAPAGNQSPRRFVTAQTFAEAERLGRKLGQAVCQAVDEIPAAAWQREVALGGAIRPASLVQRPPMSTDEAEALLQACIARYEQLQRDGAPRAEVRTAECTVFGAEGTLGLANAARDGSLQEALRDYDPIDVQRLRIGDVDLVGWPGECFVEYGLALRAQAPRETYIVSLANGELQGYIVTPEAAAQGGYEATNACFAPESGEILIEAALALCDNTKGPDES